MGLDVYTTGRSRSQSESHEAADAASPAGVGGAQGDPVNGKLPPPQPHRSACSLSKSNAVVSSVAGRDASPSGKTKCLSVFLVAPANKRLIWYRRVRVSDCERKQQSFFRRCIFMNVIEMQCAPTCDWTSRQL